MVRQRFLGPRIRVRVLVPELSDRIEETRDSSSVVRAERLYRSGREFDPLLSYHLKHTLKRKRLYRPRP